VKLDLARLTDIFSRAPFINDLGIVPIEAGDGCVSSRVVLQPRHLQHTGVVHAGVMVTLADHSMGAAAQSMAPEGFFVLTAELSIQLLRPAQGESLLCEARVVKPGRQICFTEADVYALQGERRVHVARASATMALVANHAD
jgi:uncharacterized protein (TIGR00369 family)